MWSTYGSPTEQPAGHDVVGARPEQISGRHATDEDRGTGMELNDLQDRATQISDLYDRLNQRDRGRVWTREELMLGFVGDVGDLAKLVMAAEGARSMPGGRAALEHELADCLWSVLMLAHRYDVDLAAVFTRTMTELDDMITARLADPS